MWIHCFMDKPCSTCGGFGFAELIATCSQCKIIREHGYCMWTICKEIPEDWICEACKLSNDTVSPKYGSSQSASELDRQSSKRLKSLKDGKVKYISTEEVIMLKSGFRNLESTSRGKSGSKCSLLTMPSLSKRTTEGSRTVQPKLYPPRKVIPSLIPSRDGELPKRGHMQIGSKIQQHAPHPLKELGTTAKEIVWKKQPKIALVPAEQFDSPDRKAETLTNRQPCTSSSALSITCSIGNRHVDAEPRNVNIKEDCRSTTFPSEVKENLLYFPAIEATWKGSFRILDTSTPRDVYYVFRAHPPGKVRRKAYEFSKKMPAVLQFKKLSRRSLWSDVFQDYSPGWDDIALYFFPRDVRFKGNYVSLLEHMEARDSVLRSTMDSVELLIFSSKKLREDHQRLDAQYFLWGVFRHLTNNKTVSNKHEEPHSFVSHSEVTPDGCADEGSCWVTDMEIDMVGGINIGRVDDVVPKASLRTSGYFLKGSVVEPALLKSEQHISSVSGSLDFSIQPNLFKVKGERCDDPDLDSSIIRNVKSEFPSKLPLRSLPAPAAINKFESPGFAQMLGQKFWSNTCVENFREEKPLVVEGKLVHTAGKKSGYLGRISAKRSSEKDIRFGEKM